MINGERILALTKDIERDAIHRYEDLIQQLIKEHIEKNTTCVSVENVDKMLNQILNDKLNLCKFDICPLRGATICKEREIDHKKVICRKDIEFYLETLRSLLPEKGEDELF